MKKPKDYLENCEYISQDGDTVYIDEEALETCMEDYAHQRVIEELEIVISKLDSPWDRDAVRKRIKELEQE
jgi:hypothetical protein|tara:strand:+ start:1080 stop:1292 length:213 start_codon:yes stop_codon:yes gene_type:complete